MPNGGMSRFPLSRLLSCISALFFLAAPVFASEPQPLVLAHYMPWFASREVSGKWGWHWTMDHFNPDRFSWDGERQVASEYYPLLGAYDSGDEHVLETQVLLMKFAGVQGVILDWYGIRDVKDFAMVHRNSQRLIPILKKAGLKFAICFEDQSLAQATQGKPLSPEQQWDGARDALQWLDQNWFSDDSYVRQDGRPVLLVFGPQQVQGEQWKTLRDGLKSRPLIFGLPHLSKPSGLDGLFAWIPVADGKTVPPVKWRGDLEQLYGRRLAGENVVAVAFPGFQDVYQKAGLHASYGRIESKDGATFRETLNLALKSNAPLLQLATWNDHGEGTAIEPTRANGYRYLEILQAATNPAGENMKKFTLNDLRLPVQLHQLRRRSQNDPELAARLDHASLLLFASKCTEAEAVLEKVAVTLALRPALFADTADAPDPNYHLVTDVLYRNGEGVSDAMRQRCRLDVYYPMNRKKFSTVVWFHGGGLTKGERSIPLPLRNKDVAVVAVNYRLGPDFQSPAYLEDAAAAIAWTFQNIARFGGAPESLFLSGHSAGAYLSMLMGLDPKYLVKNQIDTGRIAGLIPFSSQMITHFLIREQRGFADKQPVVDDMAPLFHVRKDAPPMLLLTGDREQELMGRYEENAYFYRMEKLFGHPDVTLRELQGFDHGRMPEPGFPLLLRFMEEHAPKTP